MVVGGQTCADEPAELAVVERYSAGADRWIELAPLPAPRRGHAAIALGEDLLVLGGTTHGAPNLDVVRHDAAADAWTVVSTLPIEARLPLVALLDDGSLVVTDGSGLGDRDDWFRSSDDARTWVRFADGPAVAVPSVGPHTALVPVAGARLVVVETWGALSSYDAATDAWTEDSGSPDAWIGAAARLGDGSVLLLRGMPTEEQAPVGTTQYEPVGRRLVTSLDALEDIGFAGCPYTTGKLEQYEAMAWGADTSSVVVTMAGTLSVYDRDAGWADLPPHPSASTGWTGLLRRDGTFVAVGGCGAEEDVRVWTP